MSISCEKEYTITANAAAATLLGYWKLNEASPADTLVDEVAARNLVIDISGGASVPGKIGTGLRVGLDDKTWETTEDNHWVMSGSFTVRFWFNPLADVLNNQGLFESLGTPQQWYISRSLGYWAPGDNVLKFYIDLVGSSAEIYTQDLTAGFWHHIVFWFEQGVGCGVRVDNGAASTFAAVESISPPLVGNAKLHLSSSHFWGDNAIDEIAIWNRKLTAAEIAADYNGGTGQTYPNVPP